jgi:phosphoribosylformimino-5-aminoimidazole carboxamide ribotide isomerase
MQVIPVLDLQGGQVVRGVAGRRHEYRPVESVLCDDARPQSVAGAFVERLGLSTAYVADLDAIGGAPPDVATYRTLWACGLALWIDAGAGDVARAEALVDFAARHAPETRIIAGLESLADGAALAEVLQAVGSERLIFSLDLKAGRPWTAAPFWQGLSSEEIATFALSLGVRRLIVLDVSHVGMGGGAATHAWLAPLQAKFPAAEFIGGGGVRDVVDLQALAAAGFHGALVATALHAGRIGNDDLRQFGPCLAK